MKEIKQIKQMTVLIIIISYDNGNNNDSDNIDNDNDNLNTNNDNDNDNNDNIFMTITKIMNQLLPIQFRFLVYLHSIISLAISFL